MKLLLDTHAFIWWDATPERLGSRAPDSIRVHWRPFVVSLDDFLKS